MSRLNLLDIPTDIAQRVQTLGGKPLNLYRVLANNPKLLASWVEFAYCLRDGNTPRELRELMILRTAQMADSAYEWAQHLKMANQAGVPASHIAQLANWRDATEFNEQEKAVLALTEAVVSNHMTDDIYQNAAKYFSPSDMIELLLTASFYCMVPRFLNAVAVTTEGEK